MKKLKPIQIIRPAVQILFIILTAMGFFLDFPAALMLLTVGSILAGAYHCGWVCPFGTLQEFTGRIGRMLGIRKRRMPRTLQRILQGLRYLLFLLFMVFATDLMFSIIGYDPRSNFDMLLTGNLPRLTALAVIGLFGVAGLFFDRPFCNYLCIEGAKHGLFSTLRIFTIKRDTDRCVNCGRCDKTCPMNIEVSKVGDMKSLQCINCFECTSSCPVPDTLTYGVRSFDKKTVSYYRNVLIAAAAIAAAVFAYSLMTDEAALPDPAEPAATNPAVPPMTEPSEPPVTDPATPTEPEEPAVTEPETPADPTEPAPTEPEPEEPAVTDPPVTEPDPPAEPEEPVVNEPEEPIITEPQDPVEPPVTEPDEPAGEAAGIADGVYTGSARGYRGPITVEVTVTDETVTSIVVTEHRDDSKWYNRAAPSTISEILYHQSTDVDSVSGATFTSQGIIDAVADALDSAR